MQRAQLSEQMVIWLETGHMLSLKEGVALTSLLAFFEVAAFPALDFNFSSIYKECE